MDRKREIKKTKNDRKGLFRDRKDELKHLGTKKVEITVTKSSLLYIFFYFFELSLILKHQQKLNIKVKLKKFTGRDSENDMSDNGG